MTPKNIHEIFIHVPQKLFIFLKTPKSIEIQNFEPQKMTRAYVCTKISEYPPGVHVVFSWSYLLFEHHDGFDDNMVPDKMTGLSH